MNKWKWTEILMPRNIHHVFSFPDAIILPETKKKKSKNEEAELKLLTNVTFLSHKSVCASKFSISKDGILQER